MIFGKSKTIKLQNQEIIDLQNKVENVTKQRDALNTEQDEGTRLIMQYLEKHKVLNNPGDTLTSKIKVLLDFVAGIENDLSFKDSQLFKAEEQLQTLTDKIAVDNIKIKRINVKNGGLTSANHKLKTKNKLLEKENRQLKRERNKTQKNRHTYTLLPPEKPKNIQTTRLKNRVKNFQAKSILKEKTEEKEVNNIV